MMMRKKAVPLGDLIRQFLRAQSLESPLNEYRAVQCWPEVAGAAIASYTGNVFMKGGILHVQIKSPALRQNLSMNRTILCQRVNAHVGAQVVSEIRFY